MAREVIIEGSPVTPSDRLGRGVRAKVQLTDDILTLVKNGSVIIVDQAIPEGVLVGELVADVAAANLGEARVHHRQQADGDRQRDGADLDGVEGVVEARDESAQKEA